MATRGIISATTRLGIAKLMQASLHYIRNGEMKMVGAGVSFDEYKRIVRFARWVELEDRYSSK